MESKKETDWGNKMMKTRNTLRWLANDSLSASSNLWSDGIYIFAMIANPVPNRRFTVEFNQCLAMSAWESRFRPQRPHASKAATANLVLCMKIFFCLVFSMQSEVQTLNRSVGRKDGFAKFATDPNTDHFKMLRSWSFQRKARSTTQQKA